MIHKYTASKCYICFVINLNQPLRIQCDKFVQFIYKVFNINYKNIFYLIRSYKFKGIANCLSQFQHYNPNYKK